MTPDATPDHPARPRLVFRVGVVGHRWDKMGVPVDQRDRTDAAGATAALEKALEATARRVLADIVTLVGEIATHVVGYDAEPIPPTSSVGVPAGTLVVVSGLAEGADRIVAAAGLDLGYQLWSVLPFARDRYLTDFDERWEPSKWSRPGAVREFTSLDARATRRLVMDGDPDRYDAYVPLGRAIIHHSDILIGIWNADQAAGAGGTANILAEARQSEIPIIRIDPSEPDTAWLEERREPDHGRSAGLTLLKRRIQFLIEPPSGSDLREAFFRERFRSGRLGKAYDVMSAHVGAMGPIGRLLSPTFPAWITVLGRLFQASFHDDWVSETRRRWEEEWSQERPVDAALRDQLTTKLAPLHGWADNLATYYANRYRSAFTTIFSLAWVAAVVAVLGFMAHVSKHEVAAEVATGVEVGVVGLIFLLTKWGQWHHFHQKWIDYRSLSERIRHLTFVWPAGVSLSFARMDEHPSADDPRATWVGWLYRATVREIGFATDEFSAAHVESCRRLLRDHEIANQIKYHDRTAARLERMHHSVHTRTNWLFALAVIVAVLHLGWLFDQVVALVARLGIEDPTFWASGGLTVLSVFLPSRAAALHGWAGHADFFGAALRSAQVETRLEDLARVVDAQVEYDSGRIGAFAVEAARAMESELLAWDAVSRSKPLQHV